MSNGKENKVEVDLRSCTMNEIPLKEEARSSDTAFYLPENDDQFVNLNRVRDKLLCLRDEEGQVTIQGERHSS